MGQYDYGDEGMLTMDITMTYDWATIEKLNGRAPFQTSLDKPEVEDSFVGP